MANSKSPRLGHKLRSKRSSIFTRSHTSPSLTTLAEYATTSSESSSMATGMATGMVMPHVHPPTATPKQAKGMATPSFASPPSTPSDGKKKRLWRSKVTKERPHSSHGAPAAEGSSLPPLTPNKAAQVLGVGVEGGDHQDEVGGRRYEDMADSDGEERYPGRLQADGGADTGRPGPAVPPPTLRKRASDTFLSLTNLKGAAAKQTKFKELGVEPTDAPRHGKGKKKAEKMLDMIPFFGSRDKDSSQSADQNRTPSSKRPPSSDSDDALEDGYDSDPETHSRKRVPLSAQRRRRKSNKKKEGKPLDMMATIAEASLSEQGSVVFEERGNAELEIIAAYNKRASIMSTSTSSLPGTKSLPMSKTMSALPGKQYQLSPRKPLLPKPSPYEPEEDEPSPLPEDADEQELEDQDELEVVDDEDEQPSDDLQIWGSVPNYSRPQYQHPESFRVRSPLQTVEHRLLDEYQAKANKELEALRQKVKELKVGKELQQAYRKSLILADEKTKLDDENLELQLNHIEARRKIRDIKTRSIIEDGVLAAPAPAEDDEEDTCSCYSIGSSIDLDEEPVICTDKFVPITKVPNCMLRVIDIPLRKQKSDMVLTANVDPGEVETVDSPKGHKRNNGINVPLPPFPPREDSLEPTAKAGHSDVPTLFSWEDADMLAIPKKFGKFHRSANGSIGLEFDHGEHDGHQIEPFPAYVDDYDEYDTLPEHTAVALPREESRLIAEKVESWSIDTKLQRPESDQFDLDVLADRKIPPAPLPKGDRVAMPTIKHMPNARQHCVIFGHKLRLVDLRSEPDSIEVGALGAPPYLINPQGRREHVRHPVKCDKCLQDTYDKYYDCEVPLCHAALCLKCAKEWLPNGERESFESFI